MPYGEEKVRNYYYPDQLIFSSLTSWTAVAICFSSSLPLFFIPSTFLHAYHFSSCLALFLILSTFFVSLLPHNISRLVLGGARRGDGGMTSGVGDCAFCYVDEVSFGLITYQMRFQHQCGKGDAEISKERKEEESW